MPSWNDEESSDDSLLSEFNLGHYLSPRPPMPENIEDPEYYGYDDCAMRCKHEMPMYRYVCFEGEDTGRRFLGCGCKEEVMCDKVHWVDKEWPVTLKNALVKVWSMYDEERVSRLHENVEQATKNYQLLQKKREVEKRNLELHKQLVDTLDYVADATSCEIDAAKRHAVELQVASLKEDKKKLACELAKRQKVEEQVARLECELAKRQKVDEHIARLEEENEKLKGEVEAGKKQTVDALVANLKEDKTKLEYYVADLLKHHHASKEKFKKIAEICGE